MRKGADFKIESNSGRRRVNINAAVRAIKSEHVVCDIAESINAQFAERLYRKLLVKHPGEKIYIICANARHNRCTWLPQWAAGQRIEFAFPAGLFAQCLQNACGGLCARKPLLRHLFQISKQHHSFSGKHKRLNRRGVLTTDLELQDNRQYLCVLIPNHFVMGIR